ncbi:hypothetical protein D3C78_563180 [compost metagenome]
MVVVALLLLSTVLLLSTMRAPSSARAALALPPPISKLTSSAVMVVPAPVPSRPWLRLRLFSPSTGDVAGSAAPLVLTSVPLLRLMVAPLRAQTPTEPLPMVLIVPPVRSTSASSASTPWPLPPAVLIALPFRETVAPSSTRTP